MAQILPPWSNRIPMFGAVAGVVGPVVLIAGVWYYGSPKFTDAGYRPKQPVPYSHKLHVGELGLDCRYCHASVEVSPVSNVPPTSTCMNCHKLVAREAPSLEPIRTSATTGKRMEWIRVHKLPDYTYFNHRVHVAAGIGCVECHGRVDEMEEVTQVEPLSMSWCLDCHRNPDPHRRPVSEVTNMRWRPPADEEALAALVAEQRPVDPPVTCSGCHR